MDWLFGGMRVVEIMLRGGFILVLAVTAFQDYREGKIQIRVLIIFGTAGMVLRGVQLVLETGALSGDCEVMDLWAFAIRRMMNVGGAMAVGGVLLLLSVVTRESIGRGDGWFFVVSGLYLGFIRNVLLLAGGLLFCFLLCSVLMVRGLGTSRDVRRLRIPLLPCLIPAGIGVMLL